MTREKAFNWLLFVTFSTGFVIGQEHHSGIWLAVRFLFQVVLAGFIFFSLFNFVTTTIEERQENLWKARPYQPKKKRDSSGMVRTSAAVAGAIGTHVTVRDREKQPASSVECRHAAGAGRVPCGDLTCESCYPGGKRPDAGLDG